MEASSPRTCRNQPGHQILVRRPPQEEHRGKDGGDAGWRGEERSWLARRVLEAILKKARCLLTEVLINYLPGELFSQVFHG